MSLSVAVSGNDPPRIFRHPWLLKPSNRHGYVFIRGGCGNITATDKLFRVPFFPRFRFAHPQTKHTVHLFQNLVGNTTHTYIKHSYTYIITYFTANSHFHILHSL